MLWLTQLRGLGVHHGGEAWQQTADMTAGAVRPHPELQMGSRESKLVRRQGLELSKSAPLVIYFLQ